MTNTELAIIVLNGLIAGIETHSEIPVQASELKMIKTLLQAELGAKK